MPGTSKYCTASHGLKIWKIGSSSSNNANNNFPWKTAMIIADNNKAYLQYLRSSSTDLLIFGLFLLKTFLNKKSPNFPKNSWIEPSGQMYAQNARPKNNVNTNSMINAVSAPNAKVAEFSLNNAKNDKKDSVMPNGHKSKYVGI